MSKRWIVTMVALALTLAACGREVGGDPAAETPDEAAPSGCDVDEVDGDLLLGNWSEYMDPDLISQFEEDYGVSVTEDFYTSNEALLAQIRAGGADFDVIVPSDYMVEIMIGEDILLPLDHDAIPNMANVAAEFENPPYDPDLAYSMPYQWGTTGLGVDLDAVGEDVVASWDLLFDPDVAGALPGEVSILDDPREGMAAALFWLGYDPNTTDEDQLQEASEVIEAARAWTVTYTSDQFAELLLTGEIVVGHGYSGGFLDSFWGADDPDRYDYVIPEEGAIIWTDNMAILADASSVCTAHTFINFILDAQNGAQLTNYTYYASPNAAATEFIEDEITEDPTIYPTAEVREKLVFLENTGDAEILYTDLFTRAQG
jgi:spermidine/putrescine-binding protein